MRFKKHSMDVTFEMVHCDERFSERESEDFAIGYTDEQRANQARTACHGDGVQIGERNARLLNRFAHDWHDLPEMFARGKLRYHTAILAVNPHLRCDNARENAPTARNNRCSGFIARGFDAEYEVFSRAHTGTLTFRFEDAWKILW
jgi:hypothetical protein